MKPIEIKVAVNFQVFVEIPQIPAKLKVNSKRAMMRSATSQYYLCSRYRRWADRKSSSRDVPLLLSGPAVTSMELISISYLSVINIRMIRWLEYC